MSEGAADVLQGWSESAPYWKKHREAIRVMFEPVSLAMMEQARVAEGQAVLDVAAGTGEPSLPIAEVCRPSGWVACTDPIGEMVAVAKREAERRGLSNVAPAQCVSEALPFRGDSFDTVVCRLGAMFFSDPVHSLREMLRVSRPSGRVVLAVWHGSEFNPFFAVTSQAMSRYAPMPLANPNAPGTFRFAELGRLARLLAQAAATAIDERIFSFRIEVPVSLEEFWPLRSEMSEILRAKTAQLSKAQLRALEGDVREAARPYFSEGRLSFPAQIILVAGSKQASPPSAARVD